MSLGTSGVVYTRSPTLVHDLKGYVCSYADATGRHLPLVATERGAQLRGERQPLGCTYAELSELAVEAPPGADGLTLLPFFQGERTPDLPQARASLRQASLANFTRANFARAVIEGTVANQVAMLEALADCDLEPRRLMLIGGAAASAAVQQILAQMIKMPVVIPELDGYVTRGAAMQAASALTGAFPTWKVVGHELPCRPVEHQISRQRKAAMAALG